MDGTFENNKIKSFDTQDPADAFEKFYSFFVNVLDFDPFKWSKNQLRMRPTIYEVREMERTKN